MIFWGDMLKKNRYEPDPLKMRKCILSQILKLGILRVVIHPDVGHKILRPMVKEFALHNLQFFSYGQKTSFWQ